MSSLDPFMAGGAAPIIQTQGLTREYRLGASTIHALRGIDLSIQKGEFVALMGPSGCGKSTLLHLLGCLDVPSAGQYTLEGQEVSKLTARERAMVRGQRIGFVFQNFFLLANLSSLENVALPLLYQRDARQAHQRASEVLARLGLADRARHRPMELSGGERQRVAIARALVNQPAILLADEPTGNLDSATGAEMMAMLVEQWKAGVSILLVTHDAQVAAYAQRVIHLRDGLILREEYRGGDHDAH
jgi:putative ABC transport system ATP-binding protein